MRIFDAIVAYHNALGLPPITQMPKKHWMVKVDEHWTLYVNAAQEPWRLPSGPVLERCGDTYVEFNGWPAGLIHPAAGGVICAGEAANETTLISALRAAEKVAIKARRMQ